MSTLVHNARIWRTGLERSSDKRQFYEWFLFDESSGKIKSCGGSENEKPKAEKNIDLKGRWVFPGFHDSHIHILGHGLTFSEHENLRFPNSIEQMQERLKVLLNDPYNAPDENNSWFVGSGFEQDLLGRYPTAADLDKVEPNRPILINHHSFHIAVLNSAGLKIAGYDETSRPTSDDVGVYPPGHEKEGAPDGILKEVALNEAKRLIPKTRKRIKRAILSALNECIELGITSVHCLDANCWNAYVELAKEEKLPVQCFFSTFYDDYVRTDRPKKSGEAHGPLLSCRCVKIFTDGALGSDTAALSIPYKKKNLSDKDNFGILCYSQEELNEMVKEIDEKGFQLEIHVIGDKAAEMAVTSLEYAGITPEKRPILVHCQVLTHDLVKRMAKLGVIAAIQPQNVPYDSRWVRDKLQEPLQRCMYAYRTMLENGIICVGSSDSPAYHPNSLQGIRDAIFQPEYNPKGQSSKGQEKCFQPDERVTFKQAVDMYTSEAAKTDFAEEYLGRLEPGYFANFIVLETPKVDGEYVDISEKPKLLLETKVLQTWARGKVLFDKKEE